MYSNVNDKRIQVKLHMGITLKKHTGVFEIENMKKTI
jgi:hypothetical protein